jgi:hypothetical protein
MSRSPSSRESSNVTNFRLELTDLLDVLVVLTEPERQELVGFLEARDEVSARVDDLRGDKRVLVALARALDEFNQRVYHLLAQVARGRTEQLVELTHHARQVGHEVKGLAADVHILVHLLT